MKIQILTRKSYFDSLKQEFAISDLYYPRSFDEFDLNIIDLNYDLSWSYKAGLNEDEGFFREMINVFETLSKIIQETKNGKILLIMPQNMSITLVDFFDRSKTIKIRDIASRISVSLSQKMEYFPRVRYEISETNIGGYAFSSDFVFEECRYESVKKSKGNKSVMVKYSDRVFITTLRIDDKNLNNIVDFLQSQYCKSEAPEWFKEVQYFNDADLMLKQEKLKQELISIEKEIDKNSKLKSILYSSGDELVLVVIDILCDIFKVSSDFKDVKKEDFNFKYKDVYFIVEIKGVNDNIKNSNIAQCKKHVTDLISTDETISVTNVKGILIINSQRGTKPNKRQPIHDDIIMYAKRENVLIITTLELLKLYIDYLNNKITIDECFDLFKKETGEFRLEHYRRIKN